MSWYIVGMALNDIRNEYFLAAENKLGQGKTPKTVYAALAFSFAMRLCEDDQDRALELLRDEWGALHRVGIVPQKVPKVPPVSNPCFECNTDTAYLPHRVDCPTQKAAK
jgi:hypothetical protein